VGCNKEIGSRLRTNLLRSPRGALRGRAMFIEQRDGTRAPSVRRAMIMEQPRWNPAAIRLEGNVYRTTEMERGGPPSGGQCFLEGNSIGINIALLTGGDRVPYRLFYRHYPPDGGRTVFSHCIYKHYPPDGGRTVFSHCMYKDYPPDGGRTIFSHCIYKHFPPDGGPPRSIWFFYKHCPPDRGRPRSNITHCQFLRNRIIVTRN
jgi:hypothetical protein